MSKDGFTAEEVFNQYIGYTFNDIIILPGFFDFDSNEVNLRTQLTKKISLNLPFISSPMDTVTEAEINYSESTGKRQSWLGSDVAQDIHPLAPASSQD